MATRDRRRFAVLLALTGLLFVAGNLLPGVAGAIAGLAALATGVAALLNGILALPDAQRPPEFRGKTWRWKAHRSEGSRG